MPPHLSVDYERQKSPRHFRSAVACSLASITFPPFLNWAEVTKSVMQHGQIDRPIFAVRKIVQAGGYSRLFLTGLDASLAREVFYNASRWMLYAMVSDFIPSESFATKFGIGFCCGIIGCLGSQPFDLIRVRQQSLAVTRQRWAIDEAAHYIQQAKFAGGRNLALPVSFPFVTLFRGWQVNCVRAGLFTAGSMATYELCKAEMNKHILEESPVTHITAGFGMGVVGTFMYMPADAIRARAYNLDGGIRLNSQRLLQLAVELYRESGVSGFWRGTNAALFRTIPACIMYPVAMEQCRKALGLDYFGSPGNANSDSGE